MERYHLGSITRITFKPTAFQYLICDQFLLVNDTDIANYADDTAPYRSANLMFKGNEDKCQIMLSTGERLQVKIGAVFTKSSRCENLLGAKIDKLMNV